MENLIDEVRKREFLWNKQKIPLGTKQKRKTDQLWQEVAEACKTSKTTAKCKWRNLRDHFLKELKKVPVYTSGGTYYIDEREKPRWVHFNNLIFLLNTHSPRHQVIDIKSESIIDIRSSDSSCSSEDTKSPVEGLCPPLTTPQLTHSLTPNNTFTSIRKIYTLEDIDPNLCATQWNEDSDINKSSIYEESKSQIENCMPPMVVIKPQPPDPSGVGSKRACAQEENNEANESSRKSDDFYKCPPKRVAMELSDIQTDSKPFLNCNEDNENLLFFRSLLPFMNKMDTMQQLRVRMRFQEILFEELGAKKE